MKGFAFCSILRSLGSKFTQFSGNGCLLGEKIFVLVPEKPKKKGKSGENEANFPIRFGASRENRARKTNFLPVKIHVFGDQNTLVLPFFGYFPGTSWPFWGEFVTDFHPLQHVLPSFSREHNALFMRPVDHEFKNKITVCNL